MRLRKDFVAVNVANFAANQMLPVCCYCGKLGVEVMPTDYSEWEGGETFAYTYRCPGCDGLFRITYREADVSIVEIERFQKE